MQLAKQGIAVDHGVYKKGDYFIGEFSDNEVQLIQQTGLPYQILINDISTYYVNRNKASAKRIAKTAIPMSTLSRAQYSFNAPLLRSEQIGAARDRLRCDRPRFVEP